MTTETATQLLQRLAAAAPLSAERFSALLGAPLAPAETSPSWQGYTFTLPAGPFAGGELRLDNDGSGALLILDPRDPPGLDQAGLDRAAFGPRLAIQPSRDVAPEPLVTETYRLGEAQLALEWTARSRRLRGAILEWPASTPSNRP